MFGIAPTHQVFRKNQLARPWTNDATSAAKRPGSKEPGRSAEQGCSECCRGPGTVPGPVGQPAVATAEADVLAVNAVSWSERIWDTRMSDGTTRANMAALVVMKSTKGQCMG